MTTSSLMALMDKYQRKVEEQNILHADDEEPQFIVIGDDLPNYSNRLPDTYDVVARLGIEDQLDVRAYQPRGFHITDNVLELYEGTLTEDDDGEAEFTVEIPLEDIEAVRFLNRAGYTGDTLPEY